MPIIENTDEKDIHEIFKNIKNPTILRVEDGDIIIFTHDGTVRNNLKGDLVERIKDHFKLPPKCNITILEGGLKLDCVLRSIDKDLHKKITEKVG